MKPYFEENGHKASVFLKRFLDVSKHFIETDPMYQSRIENFYSKAGSADLLSSNKTK